MTALTLVVLLGLTALLALRGKLTVRAALARLAHDVAGGIPTRRATRLAIKLDPDVLKAQGVTDVEQKWLEGAPFDTLEDAIAWLQSLTMAPAAGDDPNAGVAAAPPAGGDTQANILARSHRVQVDGVTFDVRLTGRQIASCARQGRDARGYAREIARLFGTTPKAASYGVKLVAGSR